MAVLSVSSISVGLWKRVLMARELKINLFDKDFAGLAELENAGLVKVTAHFPAYKVILADKSLQMTGYELTLMGILMNNRQGLKYEQVRKLFLGLSGKADLLEVSKAVSKLLNLDVIEYLEDKDLYRLR